MLKWNLEASVAVVYLGGWRMNQTHTTFPRLCWTVLQAEDMQQQIIRETFHLVSKRDDNVCNFLEGGRQVSLHLHKHVFKLRVLLKEEKTCQLIFFVASKSVIKSTSDWRKVYYRQRKWKWDKSLQVYNLSVGCPGKSEVCTCEKHSSKLCFYNAEVMKHMSNTWIKVSKWTSSAGAAAPLGSQQTVAEVWPAEGAK